MYCKIYVNFNGKKSDLLLLLSRILNASRVQNSVVFFEAGEIDASANDEYDAQKAGESADGFLFYKFILDLELEREHVSVTNEILQAFWRDGIPAVAACDYEDELINRGGYGAKF